MIIDDPADGAWNMAVDEALMENAGMPDAPAIIRFYSFAPPTLSVGRFQKTNGIFNLDTMTADGVPLVRRPSGGQAVLHSDELTYSVSIGRHYLDSETGTTGKRMVYAAFVPVLLEGLKTLSIMAKEAEGAAASTDPDCFAAAGEYEIDGEEGKKLIGSAQMVNRTAVLQHGSIPLSGANRQIHRYIDSKPGENASSSLSDELKRPVTFTEARAAFSRAVMEKLQAVESSLSAVERERAQELREERYGQDSWNLKY